MRKQKRRMLVLLPVFLLVLLTGCGKLGSIVNDIHGSLIGNNYTVYTYTLFFQFLLHLYNCNFDHP